MFEMNKPYKHSNKTKRTERNLRAMKAQFLQHGQVDWHLSVAENIFDHHQVTAMAGIDEETHTDEEVDVATAPPEVKKPPFYAVLLFNDDYTPMEFVIEILQHYFALDLDRATEVMLTVHYRGKGVAGIYPRDIAETKAQQVNTHARSRGHPLLCQIEPQPE
jgi:ATP-dependent Clp protease adaptor protein ClpS